MVDELRALLIEAREHLVFLRSLSTAPALRDDAPTSPLKNDFWTWAEGWDCDLELRIDAALGEVDNAPADESGDRALSTF
jgi:hypothetical protein